MVVPSSLEKEVSAKVPEKGFCQRLTGKRTLNGGVWARNAEMLEHGQ